jgi:predicted extracellular nuclease
VWDILSFVQHKFKHTTNCTYNARVQEITTTISNQGANPATAGNSRAKTWQQRQAPTRQQSCAKSNKSVDAMGLTSPTCSSTASYPATVPTRQAPTRQQNSKNLAAAASANPATILCQK